jgi:3-oxoacyl-[acyl-carrier-protein] synthase II
LRNVVITGAGVLSPIGADLAASWEGFLSGRLGIARVTEEPEAGERRIWAKVPDAFFASRIDAAVRKRTDRFSQYALVAAEEAVAAAGLEQLYPEHTAVVIGSTMGGVPLLTEARAELDLHGPQRVTPRLMALVIPNMAAAALALRWELHGPQLTIATACASSLDAIGRAAKMIAYGEVDVALAGGTETLLAPVVAWSLERAGALSSATDPGRASLPFDRKRDGFVMGDGSGIVVLEREEHARARGARILGRVRGYGAIADGYHVTSPEPTGRWEARAMERALEDAAVAPDEIDVIYAHGTATPVGDSAEIKAINALYADRSLPVPVTSLKGHIGHGMAASGVTSLIAALCGFADRVIVPTLGTTEPDPEARFNVVLGAPRRQETRAVQLNAFGFGGQNASLVVTSD